MEKKSLKIDVALIHYPVINRTGNIIGSAVTNLDLHDIARAGLTYGIGTCWVVVPDRLQQDLAAKIVAHWTEGYGGTVNPDRRDALSLIRIRSTLDEVIDGLAEKWGEKPYILATCARPGRKNMEFEAVRSMAEGNRRLLLLFGTAWGLAPEILERADGILPPLRGAGEYNHLSVRSAAAIILDRLLAHAAER
ncbi:MAG: RNA methyltransferase [Desulfobulbaceae bacterium]|nr:RNA methyltransferase [Desulfobulbaceae bacterium]